MKMNFQRKLVLSFLAIFFLFTAGIVVFEQGQARRYKGEAIRERLDAYADQVLRDGSVRPDSLLALMPGNLRLTLLDRRGTVLYDNAVADAAALENHASRPEIAEAMRVGSGAVIRTSASTRQPYLYYAKDNGGERVARVALPYDVRVRSFLRPNNGFLYFVVALFLVGLVLIYSIGRHFGRSVALLRDYAAAPDGPLPQFPNGEFGEIAGRLTADLNRIRENERQLACEREKLLLHIQTSAEGVCFLNPDRTVAFYNGLFLQYFNTLYGRPVAAGQQIPDDEDFAPVAAFLDQAGHDNYYESRFGRHGKEYLLRVNIFEDGSFEIILSDITAQERNRRLKQELTGNIAHELRTPVTSIRGFLEIVLDNNLDEVKRQEYLKRAYSQTKTLSELISDMNLLARIDERQEAFGLADVGLVRILERVQGDTAGALAEHKITFTSKIPAALTVRGNEGLLYSVFRNLTDNVIAHAGEGAAITVGVIQQTEGAVHLSFADTGRGIDGEHHLNRLFERFYRVGEGRTRETGGSGLGLSIVRNAVQFHGGTISVRHNEPSGLEFIIVLPKK